MLLFFPFSLLISIKPSSKFECVAQIYVHILSIYMKLASDLIKQQLIISNCDCI